ncbi:MAG TPA: peptidylprolyl isomerase [Prolixibacteraceae bacterium]|nr:peptidylprolyl isomerase [Prolixibacteraceae bacterium]
MATLQKLRNQAGVLLAVVIFIALAAFILGDLLQSGSSLLRGKQLQIARIGNESVEYPEFQERFDKLSEIYKANNQVNSVDEKAYEQLFNQTWENLVEEKIMGAVYDELAIDITPEEMFDMVQGNNIHPIIVQLFGDPQTRQVNKSNVIQFLKYIQDNPEAPQKATWLNIEEQIIKTKKSTKYNNLVAKGLYVNSLQAKNSLLEKNRSASLQFVQKKIAVIPDSVVSVSEKELRDYYKKHTDQYEQKKQKVLAYITFPIVPSDDDDQQARKWIQDLKPEFEQTNDNIPFVNINADTRFEDVFTTQAELSTELGAWAFQASENEVYGPVKEGDTYKMYKLNAVKMLPDSVRASHILLRAENAAEAQRATALMDSLKNVIETGKTSFEELARAYSQDGSASQGGDLGWFKRGVMVAPFEKAAFHAEKGDLVTAETQFGLHLIKVTEQGKKAKNVQLAVIDRAVTPSTTTYQNLYTEASKMAANAQDLKGLIAEADKVSITVRKATVGENDRNIPGLGPVRTLIYWAFANGEKGELVQGSDRSPVFEIENQFIIAAIDQEMEEGIKAFESVQSIVERAVIREKKLEKLEADFAAAKGASIEETAQNLQLEVERASGFNFAYGSVNAIGYEPAVNGAALALEVNQQSNPVVGRNGVYILQLTEIQGEIPADFAAEKKSMFANASYRTGYQAYQTLKDNTEIADKRSKFY